ncbi:energy-coupling factor ABC transporter ATP-binding protein [Propionivibrio sp.]|uniref:energy-coupling factor ABC transporter ATP-binding protein n=1 Tax=Propionivibrio sp. TaxID=2212460 RepID=UPI003BF31916
MNDCIFELSNVSYAYQKQLALDGLSLQIRQGNRVALLGANGSGKSTLLRLLDALYFPTQGELKAFGEILSEELLADDETNFAFRRRVGLVFQNPDVQIFNPTVFDEVAFGPLQLGWPKDRILRCVDEILARFAISHLKDRAPHRLSGGEKKRVALASVLILDPEVLLLDEPTASLDPESQSEVIRFLVESRNTGRTIVTATHDLDIVEDIADFVFVLDNGKVVAAGTPAEILTDQDLLRRTHLAHAHWHVHAGGEAHKHLHAHRHGHDHHAAPYAKYRPIRRD